MTDILRQISINEILDIQQQTLDELRLLIANIPSKLDNIKEFLVSEVVRSHHTDEVKGMLIKEINLCTESIPSWLIYELYNQPHEVIVTLTPTSNDNDEQPNKDQTLTTV